jgi:hypothetical protein
MIIMDKLIVKKKHMDLEELIIKVIKLYMKDYLLMDN